MSLGTESPEIDLRLGAISIRRERNAWLLAISRGNDSNKLYNSSEKHLIKFHCNEQAIIALYACYRISDQAVGKIEAESNHKSRIPNEPELLFSARDTGIKIAFCRDSTC